MHYEADHIHTDHLQLKTDKSLMQTLPADQGPGLHRVLVDLKAWVPLALWDHLPDQKTCSGAQLQLRL